MEFRNRTKNLTDRENEIFLFLLKGKNSIQIAESLIISRHTVDTHRRKILKKMGCKTTVEMITLYLQEE